MILHIILVFVLVGVVLWLVNRFVPMPAAVKTAMNIVVIILLVLWVLTSSGLMPAIP